MASPVIRGRTAVWGVVPGQSDTHSSGIIKGMSHGVDGETDFLYDGDGFTITEIFFDDKDQCNIDVVCESGTAMPARGDDITIDGIECIVQSAEVKWEQKGWKMLNIKATKFANLTEQA